MYTLHAIERTEERANLNWDGSTRMIMNAFYRGIPAKAFPAKEKDFLNKKAESIKGESKYYAGYCFLFDANGLCVTMYKVPAWFGKTKFVGKELIRKPKKYYRKYQIMVENRNFLAV